MSYLLDLECKSTWREFWHEVRLTHDAQNGTHKAYRLDPNASQPLVLYYDTKPIPHPYKGIPPYDPTSSIFKSRPEIEEAMRVTYYLYAQGLLFRAMLPLRLAHELRPSERSLARVKGQGIQGELL